MNILPCFTGKCYPDKSFSIGGSRKEKIKRQDAQYERAYREQSEVDYGNVTDWLVGKLNIGGKFCSLKENPNLCQERLVLSESSAKITSVLQSIDEVENGDYSKFYDCEENLAEPLFIVSAKLKRRSKGTYGKHGITNYGKRVLKNSCILLEQKYTKKRLGFATCTLPDTTEESFIWIMSCWSELVRRFLQKARRFHEKRNLPFIYAGCTEIQEKRFKSGGLPAPHLHFVYVCKPNISSGYTCSTQQYWEWWNDSVNEILAIGKYDPIMGVNGHIGSVKLEPIRTTAAGYLGKYISKGVAVVKDMQERGYDKFPKQWWFASMQCKKMFKASIKTISGDICAMLWNNADRLIELGIVKHLHYVFVRMKDIEKCVGITGTFTDNVYHTLFDTC